MQILGYHKDLSSNQFYFCFTYPIVVIDAQYFTVSTVEKRPNPWYREDSTNPELVQGRHLRVWNRDLELMSQCEVLAGMEKSLGMKPIGNLMAVTRVLNDKRDLWLYERNGQWRSHFEVGEADKRVLSVGWNTDASILLIHLRKDDIDYVQLWTISNYDWTLKTEIQQPSLVAAKWDMENPKKLHLLAKNGRYDLIEIESGYDSFDAIVICWSECQDNRFKQGSNSTSNVS